MIERNLYNDCFIHKIHYLLNYLSIYYQEINHQANIAKLKVLNLI